MGAVLGIAALALMTVPADAGNTVLTVAPTADTFVHASNKTTNYGKSGSLSAYATPDVETYMAFSLPPAPSGQQLTGATLRIRTTSIASAGSTNTESVKFVSGSWGETTVTYNTRPSVTGTALGTLVNPNAVNTTYTITLDASRLAPLLGTATSLAVLGGGSDGLFFNSREATNVAARPALSLTFAPASNPDTTPPDPPAEVDVTVTGHSVALEWESSNDNVGTVGYDVYRSATNGFTPDASSFVGSTVATQFEESRPTGNWFYVVTARDAAGNVSPPSVQEQATVADDPPPPNETTLTASPSADTYVHASTKTTNYGKATSLAVYGSPDVEAFLRFAFPAAPAGDTLYSASLRLVTTSPTFAPSSNNQLIRTASNSWSEASTTYNNKPTVGPIIGTLAAPTDANTPYDVDLDPDTIAGLLGTSASLAVLGTGADGFYFSSREAGTASLRPLLTLQFVPQNPDTQPPTAPTDLTASVVENRVTLNWTASTDDNAVTRYDIHRGASSDFTPSDANQIATSSSTTYTDSVFSTGTYYYRIVARDAALNSSDPSDSTSAVVDTMPTVITVAAFGDSACAPGYTVTATACRQGDVENVVQAANPDYVIALGDLQYNSGTYAQFLGSWDVTWGAFKSRTLPVVGNHEFADPSTLGSGYFDYWLGQGVNSGPYGDRGVGIYTRMIGSWRFIALNSECTADEANADHMLVGGCDVGSPEYQWLSNVLDQNTAQCTVVAFHRPRWSTGPHGPYVAMAAMWDLMATKGVDVVLNGHNHDTEIFKPIGASGNTTTSPVLSSTGIREFVAGSGGKDLSPFPSGSNALLSATQARNAGTFGALILTLKDGSYDWAYHPVAGQSYTNFGTNGAFSGSNVACN